MTTRRPAAPRPWVEAVREGRTPAPVVLVLGGVLSPPSWYGPFGRLLRAAGAAAVVISRVWTQDWLIAAWRGLGSIVTRGGRALLEASARSEEQAGGAPVLVIGHSAGGMTARLLTAPIPFEGRGTSASGRMGALVTLGTPHLVAPPSGFRNRAAGEAAAFANREVPGAFFAPRVGYLAVGSRSTVGRIDGTGKERSVLLMYRELLGDPDAIEVEGDGLIPLRSALLPGAPSIVLDDAAHGQGPGLEWYGSPRFVPQWWPAAVATWRGALSARVAELDVVRDQRRCVPPGPARL